MMSFSEPSGLSPATGTGSTAAPTPFRQPSYSRCVWCGGTPTTIEDLLPNWLRLTWKLAPDATFRIGRNFGDRSELVGGSKAKRIKHVSMKVRAVCSRCNSGWMSDLERQSQPILGPLTRGQALTLGPSTQATVSAWAMKTTMMAAFRVAIEAAPEFRSAMVERREPPPGSSVHLAHLDPIALRVRVEPLLYPSDATPSDETRTGFVGYLALDRLGMFVFLNPSTLPAPEIIGGKGRRLHSAWPIRVLRNLVWPPSESLRVDELDEVLNGMVAHLTRD